MDPIQFKYQKKGTRSGGRLDELTRGGTLGSKLKLIHSMIRERYDFIDRLAVAIYDPYSSKLKTFVSGHEKKNPLPRYEFPLKDALSLLETIVKGPRVVNDLSIFSGGLHDHTKKIREQGYQSSYTVPVFSGDIFQGFIFLNSFQKNCFPDEVVQGLELYCHIIATTLILDVAKISNLHSALNAIVQIQRANPVQSGFDAGRMSRISRWIAEELVNAGKQSFTEEQIERLYQFSALHDVGMISVPITIIQKKERLEEREFAVMTTHTERGLDIIDAVIKSFHLESMPGVEVLRNIVLYHHEKMDGSGYPYRLSGNKIPIEARITAVADIFDALTSDRPYRPAFTTEAAFHRMHRQARRLDGDCLAALEAIQPKLKSEP